MCSSDLRLVAKGYTQREGEDYFDTYSPVARLTTIRVLLFLAASYGLIVHQMDVKIAPQWRVGRGDLYGSARWVRGKG